MTSEETRSITQIPETLISSCNEYLWHYTVGFVRVEQSGRVEDAILLGSGVLVKVGQVRAILTADHVLDVLPRSGRLGLVLSQKEGRTTIDVSGTTNLSIGRGDDPERGPDIGAVLLDHSTASALEAQKSYYNLDIRKDQILNSPPGDREGIWIVQGFVEEMTVEEPAPSRYNRVKAFCQFGAVGGVEDYVSCGKHDYYSFPLAGPPSKDIPSNFGGCSGGGFWHALLVVNENDELAIDKILLQGLAYFQRPPREGLSALRCHGFRSIYDVAYRAIGQGTT